ncbi:hypothetical protein DPMN_141189 [Dreissena polymorpha]|uniref:Uncharacterized protein n=1 Tax=Dreissena polymorpha TaxID=45954 RepID=A0A9D4JI23_DREPO|nr:hypothetical protein DPMN_141189 [Dreissena polymorpha]
MVQRNSTAFYSEYEKEIESTKMTDYLVLSQAKQDNLCKQTLADHTLRIVIDQIGNGWSNTPREAKPYVSVRDEFTCKWNYYRSRSGAEIDAKTSARTYSFSHWS